VSDDEVSACLRRAAPAQAAAQASTPGAAGNADPPVSNQEVRPEAGVIRLAGHLTVPENAPGIVVFAHGSGSSRHGPGNRHVADVLTGAGLGPLLFDLLTRRGNSPWAKVFDIGLLAGRLAGVTSWLRAQPRGERRHRLFRCQHRRRGRAVGRRTRRRHRGRGIPRRPP
jgi:putative phosphoribosyl transferase